MIVLGVGDGSNVGCEVEFQKSMMKKLREVNYVSLSLSLSHGHKKSTETKTNTGRWKSDSIDSCIYRKIRLYDDSDT